MSAREIRGEHGPELVSLPGGAAVRPKRHLRPVAAVFAAPPPPPTRVERAWELVADLSLMVAALAIAAWLDWREQRRARRWQP
jgi:hypothetical protein